MSASILSPGTGDDRPTLTSPTSAPPHATSLPLATSPSQTAERAGLAAYPRDPAAACSCELSTETGPAGDIVVLRVVGDIDMMTLPVVEAALTTALEHASRELGASEAGSGDAGSGDLVVDLAGVGFCCVRGFALLADTAESADTATGQGVRYALSGMLPQHDRLAALLWPELRLPRYRSVAAAVTAIRIDQTHQRP